MPRPDPAPTPDDVARRLKAEPPHAAGLEYALLGRILSDPGTLDQAAEIIAGPDDFHRAAHGLVWSRVTAMYVRGEAIDGAGVASAMEAAGELNGIGGVEWIAEMMSAASASREIALQHAQAVRDAAVKRQAVEAAMRLIVEASDPDTNADQCLGNVAQAVQAIADARQQGGEAVGGDVLVRRVIDDLDSGHDVAGLPTGFAELDELTVGMHPGEMIVLGARPSQGKTALCLSIAQNVALRRSAPVGILSMEMGKDELMRRMVSSEARVEHNKFRRQEIDPSERSAIDDAARRAWDHMQVDDSGGLSILQARAKARQMQKDSGIELLIIDYLQLMSGPSQSRDGRQNEVSEISRGVKALARELEIPVLVLSQLNRGVEAREDKRPRMSDIRESGSVEQDADVILLLHREAYYHKNDTQWLRDHEHEVNVAELAVAKQRNGPTGLVRLHFHGPTMRFSNLAAEPYQNALNLPS